MFRGSIARALVDISRRGAQVSSKKRMSPGDRVKLKIMIPRFGDMLKLGATVRWCAQDKHAATQLRFFIGLSFDDIDKRAESILTGLERWFEFHKRTSKSGNW